MKAILFRMLGITIGLIPGYWLMAQSTTLETSILPIMNQARTYVDRAVAEYYTLTRIEFDLLGKSPKGVIMELVSGREYTFHAFGSRNRIKNVDIKIYRYDGEGEFKHNPEEQSWELVAQDRNLSNLESKLSYRTLGQVSQIYKVEIEAKEFMPDFTIGRYGLLVYYH